MAPRRQLILGVNGGWREISHGENSIRIVPIGVEHCGHIPGWRGYSSFEPSLNEKRCFSFEQKKTWKKRGMDKYLPLETEAAKT